MACGHAGSRRISAVVPARSEMGMLYFIYLLLATLFVLVRDDSL
jgi:hypothetical protein